MEALAAGATDFVTKPANMGSVMESMARLQADLIPKIKACVAGAVAHHTATRVAPAPASPPPPKASTPLGHNANPPIDIICVGSSTGGPNALADVFSNVRGDLPVPVVVTQHMPPLFTAVLAESLSRKSPLRFHEGAEGMELQPGHVYIAPGGRHMEVRSKGLSTIIHLHDGPPEHSCRPAVDVLFRSVAATYGGAVLAIVLTGMGSDGARGCVAVRERKGRVVVQDEASSVVWGMPGSVVQAGAADKVLPPAQIATEINMCVQAVNRFAA
jgi:two-component system chemotaxis response regulator CheB